MNNTNTFKTLINARLIVMGYNPKKGWINIKTTNDRDKKFILASITVLCGLNDH